MLQDDLVRECVEPQRARLGDGALREQADELARPHLDPALQRRPGGRALPRPPGVPAPNVDEVRRDLQAAVPGKQEPDRLDARQAAARLAYRCSDRPSVLQFACLEREVERDQQRSRADEHAAGAGSSRAGPKSGRSSPESSRRCSSSVPPRLKNAGRSPSALAPYRKTGSPSSSAMRLPSESATSSATPSASWSGTRDDAAAPMRGWMPSCSRRSISSTARATPASRDSSRSGECRRRSCRRSDGGRRRSARRAGVPCCRTPPRSPRLPRDPGLRTRSAPTRGAPRTYSTARPKPDAPVGQRPIGKPASTDSALFVDRRAPARPGRLPTLRRSRLPARIAAGRPRERRPARLPLRPGAGHRRGSGGAPWRGRAGRTLRRWLQLDEELFYETFTAPP